MSIYRYRTLSQPHDAESQCSGRESLSKRAGNDTIGSTTTILCSSRNAKKLPATARTTLPAAFRTGSQGYLPLDLFIVPGSLHPHKKRRQILLRADVDFLAYMFSMSLYSMHRYMQQSGNLFGREINLQQRTDLQLRRGKSRIDL